uniref:FERM domain-containing protein n=1 Tax=Timema cristinae TaxID=61476 RepID=A0A7R9GSU1_TIMCR|nr:unnamed protein product [Timema cristinae]
MRSSTVSAPVLAISTPLPSSCNKYVAVELLTKEILYFIVETKSRSKELYSQTCLHLGSQGMVDYDLFGLAILSGEIYTLRHGSATGRSHNNVQSITSQNYSVTKRKKMVDTLLISKEKCR